MLIFLKIAWRNVLENRRKTLLIGITLLLSCVLLLFSFALGNGMEEQILGQYRNSLSGDVTVVWENVKEYEVSDPSRLHFSAFKMKRDAQNRTAIALLDAWLEDNKHEIDDYYKVLKGDGVLDTGSYASYSIIVGLDEKEKDFLTRHRTLRLVQGNLGPEYGILISDIAAKENNLRLGDWVILDGKTASGYVNSLEYQVVGLYQSHSDFDSIYVYMTAHDFRELFDYPDGYFQSVRIYLKNQDDADSLAQNLDAGLLQESGVLRAESIFFSGEFYLMIAGFLKGLVTLFVVFILCIIAAGIRSVIRMNLFERIREFGTLRAVGYSRTRCFCIIFLEISILALIFFILALGITSILVYSFGQTGIPVGKGAIAYILGGETIVPMFRPSDILWGLLILIGFSAAAPIKPALKLLYQNVTNLLSQNQKNVSVMRKILGSLFHIKHKKFQSVHE